MHIIHIQTKSFPLFSNSIEINWVYKEKCGFKVWKIQLDFELFIRGSSCRKETFAGTNNLFLHPLVDPILSILLCLTKIRRNPRSYLLKVLTLGESFEHQASYHCSATLQSPSFSPQVACSKLVVNYQGIYILRQLYVQDFLTLFLAHLTQSPREFGLSPFLVLRLELGERTEREMIETLLCTFLKMEKGYFIIYENRKKIYIEISLYIYIKGTACKQMIN